MYHVPLGMYPLAYRSNITRRSPVRPIGPHRAHSGAAAAAQCRKAVPSSNSYSLHVLFEVSYWEGLGYRTFCRATGT
jgi:hypothetical protein